MPVPPDSPGTANWHEGKPGPSCSMEDLCWYCIREIGKLQGTARANGKKFFNLKMDVGILKGRVGTKAEAHLVQDEFNKVRQSSTT